MLLQEAPSRLRSHHVSEASIGPWVSGSPKETFTKGARKNVEEVRLLLVVVRYGAANLGVLLEPELELGDPDSDTFHIFNRLEMLSLHFSSHLLQLYGLAMVNVPYNPAPGVHALQVVGTFEDGVGLRADAVTEKAPHLVV